MALLNLVPPFTLQNYHDQKKNAESLKLVYVRLSSLALKNEHIKKSEIYCDLFI